MPLNLSPGFIREMGLSVAQDHSGMCDSRKKSPSHLRYTAAPPRRQRQARISSHGVGDGAGATRRVWLSPPLSKGHTGTAEGCTTARRGRTLEQTPQHSRPPPPVPVASTHTGKLHAHCSGGTLQTVHMWWGPTILISPSWVLHSLTPKGSHSRCKKDWAGGSDTQRLWDKELVQTSGFQASLWG